MLVALVAGSVVGGARSSPARAPRKAARRPSRSAPTSRSAGSSGCSSATRSSTGTSTPSSDLKAGRRAADKPIVTRSGQVPRTAPPVLLTPTPGPHSMRAVNLLTPDLRSAQKGSGAPRPSAMDTTGGIGAFIVLGALALFVAGVAGYVLVQQRGQGAQGEPRRRSAPRTTRPSSAPPSSSPTPTSRRSPSERASTVQALAERPLRLGAVAARPLPRAARRRLPQLAQRHGRRAPARAARAPPARRDRPRPPSSSPGCTRSQPAVATLMSRLRNVQGVTRVSLAKSEKAADAVGAGARPGPSTRAARARRRASRSSSSSRRPPSPRRSPAPPGDTGTRRRRGPGRRRHPGRRQGRTTPSAKRFVHPAATTGG